MSSSRHDACAGSKVPAAEELVARARALAPRLRERAIQAERDRNIPKESVQEYIDAGLMRTITPKRWGGYEHDHEVAFDIAIELGRSTCGSSAWCLNYMSDHLGILAHFPEQAQSEVWSDGPDVGIATSAAPTGKAEVAPGGYRLNGKWSWCSGITHCQWIMIGGLIHREGDHHPDMRLFLVPTSDVTVLEKHTDFLRDYRKTLLELLLSETSAPKRFPDDDPSTHSEFYRAVREYGAKADAFPRLDRRKPAPDPNPFIQRERFSWRDIGDRT